MARKEILLGRLPRLDFASIKGRRNARKPHNGSARYEVFSVDSSGQLPWYETIDSEFLTRLKRRETIVNRPREKVGRYAKEWDHEQPAELANSVVKIYTNYGHGLLPFESSHNLIFDNEKTAETTSKKLEKIKEVYIIQHGVMRNAKDYHKYFMNALGKRYDPETMLVIAPQFCAPVDLKKPKKRTWKDLEPGEILERTSTGFRVRNGWNDINLDEVLRWRYTSRS